MRRDEAGFTLLELLVALVLAGFVSVLLAQGLRTGSRVWTGSELRSDRLLDAVRLHDVLRRHLRQAAPIQDGEGPQDLVRTFFAGRDRMSFVIADPVLALSGGMYRATYEISGPAGARTLALTLTPWASTGETIRVTLIGAASSIEFSYYGQESGSGSRIWRPQWSGNLPDLVRLSVTLSDGTRLPGILAAIGGATS